MASGSVTFTRTGGAEDTSSPRAHAFTGTELDAGSHTITGLVLVDGAVYSVTFTAMDLAGNMTSVTNTNVTYDTTAASVSIESPLSNAVVNTAAVSYTLTEAITAGDIIITRTGGTVDALSPYTYTLTSIDRTAGSHTVNPGTALVNGAIYKLEFIGVKDAAGNDTALVSSINVLFDTQSVAVTNTSPTRKSIVTMATVGYTLSEEAQYGKVTFTWTGGMADSSSSHEYTFISTELTAGSHTAVDTKLPLVNGAFYTVTFSFTDKASNPATTVSNALIFFDSNYGKGPVGNVANEDGLNTVNDADVAKLQSVNGTRPGDPNWNPVCDLDRNNRIDANDLMILMTHYGETTL